MKKNGVNVKIIKKYIYLVIIFISVLWSLLTSASYLMPATEFFFRYLYNNPNQEDNVEVVYVNSPRIVQLLNFYVAVFNVQRVDITKLDGVNQIDKKGNYWLVWDKKYDSEYDDVRDKFGFAYSKGYRTEPSFNVSNRAYVLHNFQSVVAFIRYGEFEILKPLEELAVVDHNVIKNKGTLTTSIVADFNGEISRLDTIQIYFPAKSEYDVNVKGIYADDEVFNISKFFSFNKDATASLSINNERLLSGLNISITSKVEEPQYKIYIGQLSYPDVTYGTKVLINGRVSNYLTDDRLSSTNIFDPSIVNEILINDENYGKYSSDDTPIASYSFSSIAYRDFVGSNSFSWSLYGSYDGLEWQLMDERTSEKVSISPEYSTYFVKRPNRFSYYKFIFDTQKEKFGLSEIKLTPIKMTYKNRQ